MPIVKASASRQVVIPKKIWDTLKLQAGDYFKVEIEKNRIVLEPKKLMSKDELWYWSKAGQREINKALADVAAGRVKHFSNVDDLIKDLNTPKHRR